MEVMNRGCWYDLVKGQMIFELHEDKLIQLDNIISGKNFKFNKNIVNSVLY